MRAWFTAAICACGTRASASSLTVSLAALLLPCAHAPAMASAAVHHQHTNPHRSLLPCSRNHSMTPHKLGAGSRRARPQWKRNRDTSASRPGVGQAGGQAVRWKRWLLIGRSTEKPRCQTPRYRVRGIDGRSRCRDRGADRGAKHLVTQPPASGNRDTRPRKTRRVSSAPLLQPNSRGGSDVDVPARGARHLVTGPPGAGAQCPLTPRRHEDPRHRCGRRGSVVQQAEDRLRCRRPPGRCDSRSR